MTDQPKPFGLMLKNPGAHYERAPCVATGQPEDLWDGSLSKISPCDLEDGHWSVFLPHHCDEWIIATGDREHVLAEAERFRAELDKAIAMLRYPSEVFPDEGNMNCGPWIDATAPLADGTLPARLTMR